MNIFLAPLAHLTDKHDQSPRSGHKPSTHKLNAFEEVDEEQNSKGDQTINKGSKDSSMINKHIDDGKIVNHSIKRTKGNAASIITIKRKSKCFEVTEKFLNSYFFQGLMTTITVYCLFGDDVRQIAFNAEADPVFYILTIISFFMFTIEIIISCIVQEDYWLGFYFWLDIISTVSLVADVGWIMDAIAGVGSSTGNGSNVQQATKLARAGRGARIGTKAARLARIIRLIRLLRIVKLYKSANMAMA